MVKCEVKLIRLRARVRAFAATGAVTRSSPDGPPAAALVERLTTEPIATRTSRDSANTSIGLDHLRVALSRATETLAFVDVAGNDDSLELSAELFRGAARYDADDLIEHFAGGHAAGGTRAGANQRRASTHRHGAVQVLLAVNPPDLVRLGQPDETQGHLNLAAERF